MASKLNSGTTVVVDTERLHAHPRPRTVLLLPVQVAALTGHSAARLAQMRRCGRGPRPENFGRHVLYRLSDVLAWFNAPKVEGVRHGA